MGKVESPLERLPPTRDVQAPLDEPKLRPTVRIEEEAPK